MGSYAAYTKSYHDPWHKLSADLQLPRATRAGVPLFCVYVLVDLWCIIEDIWWCMCWYIVGPVLAHVLACIVAVFARALSWLGFINPVYFLLVAFVGAWLFA